MPSSLDRLDLDKRTTMDRRQFLAAAGAAGLACVAGSVWGQSAPQRSPRRQPNILFIGVDDLRPQLGCYGRHEMVTPHIDRLAAQGTRFNRAYCRVPTCGPSRVSLLTGLRSGAKPWTTGGVHRPFVSLPAYLGGQGYHTVCNGKILHFMKDRHEDWSEPPWRSAPIYFGDHDWANYNAYGLWQNPASGQHVNPRTHRGPYEEHADVPDNAYQCGKLADKTIDDLKRLKAQDKPFFLACGFWRPHLPFNSPSRYWNLYHDVKPASNRFKPKNLPPVVHSSPEIDKYGLAGPLKDQPAFDSDARHGYFACVSYVDAQIGRVLTALDSLGLTDNTIVVLWADHGWNLGEHTFWGKHNTMNNSLHTPLIIRAPGRRAHNATDALVENVDIYPTVCELAGLNAPGHLEGTSMVPLLDDPHRRWKSAAFSVWHGCRAVRTDRYLYTQWEDKGEIKHRMLYDHRKDPEENNNIADDPAAAKIVQAHSEILRLGWRHALPPAT